MDEPINAAAAGQKLADGEQLERLTAAYKKASAASSDADMEARSLERDCDMAAVRLAKHKAAMRGLKEGQLVTIDNGGGPQNGIIVGIAPRGIMSPRFTVRRVLLSGDWGGVWDNVRMGTLKPVTQD